MRLHPTAIVEDGVPIGEGTVIWDSAHIRRGARIGSRCIVGEKSYVAGETSIGDLVKINAFVYVCAGVTIERGVMVAAGTVFTNDLFPRATTTDLRSLRTSEVDEHTRPTLVREGATIGAHCTIGSGLVIGRFAMLGMASVVTRSIPDFALALGAPARTVGWVCRCGQPVVREAQPAQTRLPCAACGLAYAFREGQIVELSPPAT
ncbi:MAG: acyltransferase [Vulcanimicrobiaceae bacterium]